MIDSIVINYDAFAISGRLRIHISSDFLTLEHVPLLRPNTSLLLVQTSQSVEFFQTSQVIYQYRNEAIYVCDRLFEWSISHLLAQGCAAFALA